MSRKRLKRSRWLGSALGTIGAGVGAHFGGPIGAVYGRAAGNFGGDLFHTVTGFGDYEVNTNTLIGEGQQVPYVKNEPTANGVTINHREYLMDVITSSTTQAFKIQTFNINPGLAETFPFLSQIANNFTEYILEGAIFAFNSTSGDALNSTNTALGVVVMSSQYNVYDADFTSKSEMELHQYTTSAKPSSSFLHPIECAPHQTPVHEFYTRNSTPSSGDLRLSDIGKFSIATVGMQGTAVNIGELWVTYQVTLLKPRLFTNLGRFAIYCGFYNGTGTNTDSANPLGNAADITPSSLNTEGFSWATDTLTLPRRSFPYAVKLVYSVDMTPAQVMHIPTIVTSNCTRNIYYAGSTNLERAPNTEITTQHIYWDYIVTDGNYEIPTYQITWGIGWTGGVSVLLECTELSNVID